MPVDETKLSWSGVGECGQLVCGADPTIDPPGVETAYAPRGNPPFDRMRITAPRSLLKIDGAYVQVEHPTDEQLAAAEHVYSGGRQTVVTTLDEIAALEAAGYEVRAP